MHTKKVSRFLSLLMALALMASLMPTALADGPAVVAVTGVTLDKSSIELTVGKEETLTATVAPADATDKTVTWESSDSAVATVDGGKVKAVKAGTARITATAGDKTATCNVKVTAATVEPTQISLSPKSVSVVKGKKTTLTPEITPEGAADAKVKWTSGTPSVATVDDNGVVTGVAKGTAIITATVDGYTLKDTCEVTVTDATGITINKSTLSLEVNGTETLTATVTGNSGTPTWESSDATVATVNSSGLVKALKVGKTTITAKLSNGDKATCAVTVNAATPRLSNTSLTLNVGKSSTLTMENLPSGATVSWSISSGSSYLSMTSSNNTSCTVKGDKAGTGKVTAAVKVGSTTTNYVCTVTVKDTNKSLDTINYTTKKNTAVAFKSSNFRTVCSDYTGYSLEYVQFSQPSTSRGTLYYEYTSSGKYDHKVSNGKYYHNPSSSRYDLSEVYFVPASGSTTTTNISYTAYYNGGKHFDGTVTVKISGSGSDISYKIHKNATKSFSNGDFDDYCKSETGTSRFDYIKFDSISSSKGTLYYKYDTNSQKEYSTSTKYYRSSSSAALSDLTFVPKKNYEGTVSIGFTGYSADDEKFTGTVEIVVGSASSGDISYKINKNATKSFSNGDFDDYCKSETGTSRFDYVKFDSISSSKGTLYYKYDTNSQKEYSTSTKYYRSSSSAALSDLTFVPKKDYTGTVEIDFTGYSDDNEKFSGTVSITVGSGSSTTVKGDVTYTVSANTPVSLSVNDFNDFCKKETSYNLDYILFDTTSSTQGTMYYQYGESSQKTAGTSTKYYRSASPYLKDLTFVPKNGFTGAVEIGFTYYNTNNDKKTGTLGILFESLKDPGNITYTTTSKPVTFVNSDFVSACAKRGGDALKSVKFTLPDESAGTLYYNYVSPTSYGGKVTSSTIYTNGTGSGSIGSVTFLPKAGYSGITTISYVGTDNGGNTYTGSVFVTVTPATKSSTFGDMSNHAWAASSVDFLCDYKVVNGTSASTYDPAGSITRGDFILMLYRAFGLSSSAGENFRDVPADSYYADAIAAAKAMGIAQGSNNRFNPQSSLTREDAMVLLHRTMEKVNRPLSNVSTSSLNNFGDSGKISSYAQSAVAALVNAGVVKGDDKGNFNPKNSISRAEMAVALHRVLTL